MSQALQRKLVLLFLLAPLPLAARCQNPNGTDSVSDSKSPASQPSAQTPDADNQTKPAVQSPAPDTSASAATLEGPAYTFKFNIPADKTLYFVVENNFTDRGGVPPLLSFTTYADDKRTLIQTRAPLGSGAARPSQPGEVTMLWQCDRFEVRERGLKEEVKFDSLRDSYPRAELRELGSVPGSKVIFDLNMRTGDARNRRIDHNKFIGPPTRRRLSRTTMRCAVNEENLAKLMDDLGPLYFPGKPVRVGETWTATRSEAIKSFGQTHLDYAFQLTQVKDVEGRKIGVISVSGNTRLIPEPQQEKPPPRPRPGAASQPATTQRTNEKPREFKIDKAVCRGTIEFDFTRGELLSMDLTRELDLSATMESEEMPGLRLETGAAHRLRVQVSQTPPPKPIIAGGPKPPADDPPEPVTPAMRKNASRRFQQNPRPATQPARPIPSRNSRPTIGRNGTSPTNQRTTSQPARTNNLAPNRLVGPPYVSPTSRPSSPPMQRRRQFPATSQPGGGTHGGPIPSARPAGNSSNPPPAPTSRPASGS